MTKHTGESLNSVNQVTEYTTFRQDDLTTSENRKKQW